MSRLPDRAVASERCRACGGALAIPFCDLGVVPVANSFLPPDFDLAHEPRFRLNALACADCRLVQLDTIVDASAVFDDYAYFSSISAAWVEHARRFCVAAAARFGLAGGGHVIEVASNDGYLLRHFVEMGIDCLGIEPAANVAAEAVARGVPTVVDFLTPALARQLVSERGPAALVVANNVVAHVPDITAFAEALAILAGESGVVSIECPHLLRLIDGAAFDTIYHEHYFYWSLHALERLLGGVGLKLFDVERLSTHGGSLRVMASAAARELGPGLADVRAEEAARNVGGEALYRGFQPVADAAREGFASWLAERLAAGQRIAGYGAAAKGNTLLTSAGVAPGALICVGDGAAAKQGRLLPGTHAPVVSPEELLALAPDAILILPWNIRDELAGWLRGQGYAGELWTAIPAMTRLP